ncbi:hypothetical protein M8C21_023892, partial [Ambrosia artemisiifolia]
KEDFVVNKELIEELKGRVRRELMITASGTTQYEKLIKVIDAIQHLGVAYLFYGEIEEALQHIYATYGDNWIDSKNLESSSLWFRLLRQQGFNNHVDEKGRFKETLCNDVQGMLALYEATYMRVEGEKLLDEALEFTKTHLAIIAKDPSCDSSLRAEIQQELKQPLRKKVSRLEALRYMPIYQQQPTHNEVLLKLAKLDFNILQAMHKKELSPLCKSRRPCSIYVLHVATIGLTLKTLKAVHFGFDSYGNKASTFHQNHMDEKGRFKETLCNDVQGMLALYEAAYMRVEGEKVLDEALEFTKTHLAIIAKDPSCDSSLRTEIQQALKQPLRKMLPRLEAIRYMPLYQQQPTHNEFLLKLAKLDFNILQAMHKKELSQICKWWKDLDLQNTLPYVRDRLVEVYFEPEHFRTRMFLIKTCMWLVVLDDTFDNYGTYEELEVFTQAVQRWSLSCLDMLPTYMKLIYQELLCHHQEMEESLEKEGKSYQIEHVREMAKEYIHGIFLEAKWLKEGYIPTLEEYMSNALITVGQPVMIARAYVGRGDMVTEETFKWIAKYPPIVKASCLIFRLMDDITTHEEEQERGHAPSCIECYRKETGVSEEEACDFFSKQVEDAWKVINRESLRPTDVPFHLLMPAINFARAAHVLYTNNNGFTHAGEEVINHIKSLLVHPIVV